MTLRSAGCVPPIVLSDTWADQDANFSVADCGGALRVRAEKVPLTCRRVFVPRPMHRSSRDKRQGPSHNARHSALRTFDTLTGGRTEARKGMTQKLRPKKTSALDVVYRD